jgi:thiol-disulfide isomerase/thioredoxin
MTLRPQAGDSDISTDGARHEAGRPAPAPPCGTIRVIALLEPKMSKPPSPTSVKPRLSRLLLTAALLAAAPLTLLAAPPAVDQPAPQLIVSQLDGHAFDLAKLRGKVVLVNVWATWCSPCRAEMPTLNAFYRRYHARGLALLGLSIDDASAVAQVRQVMRQFSYPGALASAAKVNGFGEPIAVPITYVIDAHGVIRAQLQAEGPAGVSKQALEQAVVPLLAQ